LGEIERLEAEVAHPGGGGEDVVGGEGQVLDRSSRSFRR
jgi:hypothetical protein